MTDHQPQLELDSRKVELRTQERELRLWRVEVPRLRVVGYLLLAILMAVGGRAANAPSFRALAIFVAACTIYAAASSLFLRLPPPGSSAVRRTGLAFLALDFIPIGAALWLTGAEASLFFFLPMAHVANQASRGSGHVFVFGQLATASWVVMLAFRSAAGYSVDWRTGLLKALAIWCVCLYVALSARSTDRLRNRIALLFRTARDLVRELEQKTRLLEESREVLHVQATRDAVTGLWNRSAILDVVERGLRRARHEGGAFGIVIADLDWFKDINDAYGHLAGDRALYETGRRMTALLRPHDAVGRWGGEEFLIALPDCGRAEAATLAERLRAGLEKEEIRPADAPPLSITSSFGVAAMEAGESTSAEALVRAADHALYRAKRRGRNRVEIADGDDAGPVQPPPLPVP
ncbi:MAG: GGDEF domain-containing protein [Thermoanaerobaculia bacterium]